MKGNQCFRGMVFTKPLRAERALAVFLHQEKKYSYREIALRTKLSKSSVRRVLFERKSSTSQDKNRSRGRPQLLNLRIYKYAWFNVSYFYSLP